MCCAKVHFLFGLECQGRKHEESAQKRKRLEGPESGLTLGYDTLGWAFNVIGPLPLLICFVSCFVL